MERLILDRGAHSVRAVSSLSVVEDLEVFEDRFREFDVGRAIACG
jgi:hypothetical protein